MAAETKHTPGPWLSFHEDGVVSAYEPTGGGTARIVTIARHCSIANARLIAAAPDLLEALKLQLAYEAAPTGSKGRPSWMELVKVRDTAIAKAEGLNNG